ncbi:hypothetical protein NIES2119_05325 [[Phormidium ambiguum] IAM M-71]|uniref:DUF29 domain-containing protein n=1 Tax=[Phormidium ambiguum] IAM M-71 TaxID=454136 RepID=A0A1U7IQH1_9CYAN|nr:DUF29 family protein [Phormidium ambiguum]OKH39681.1 hypothetical protein NIES2119_05325 [Phormidium ambiguum IAM M-71]
MVQELLDLRASILAGRYEEALTLIDELEAMGKQAIIRNIESFLVRLMIHLIKNQIEQRLTNSWANSISDLIVQIKKLNLKDNKTSYYINSDEWQSYLEAAIKLAIRPASLEIFNGQLKAKQISERLDLSQLITTAKAMLDLTYTYPAEDLPEQIDLILAELPGGEDWLT